MGAPLYDNDDLARSRKELNILVVEDNEADAERLARHLRRDASVAWTVTWERELSDAMETLATVQFDAVLLDLSLPDAVGFEALTTLVAANPHCPVVVQSGLEDQTIAAQAIANGAQDYLTKANLTASSLARSVNNAMIRHRLVTTQQALVASNTELDDFAHVVAHDLRAPVRTARLLANRLVASIEPDPSEPEGQRQIDLGGRLDNALLRLDTMVLGMLEYSGIRATDVELQAVQLAEAVYAALNDVAADGEAVRMTSMVAIDPTLEVVANHVLLQRVLGNLLSNSIKFVKRDTPLHLEIEAHIHNNSVRLRMTDNGIGIPKGAHERVFELTERLDPTAAGFGFGLAICRRSVTKMGGSIHFDPTVEVGASVMLTLALADRDYDEAEANQSVATLAPN